MSWDTLLPAPIAVPGGKPLVTLRDAGMLIQKLPKAKAETPAWRAATEALMLAAEGDGWSAPTSDIGCWPETGRARRRRG
jgi:hypothetical protein